jgi:hypothetical protein
MKYPFLVLVALFVSFCSFAALPPITGSASICVGSSSTLSNAVTGGTWTSGGPTVATIDAVSGVVSGVAVGTADITYTDGTDFAYAIVTVNALPAPITGVAATCAGSTSTLVDVTAGGLWTSTNPSVASIDFATGVATGVAAGTATISYVIPSGCASVVVFTVNVIPVISTGAPFICVGSTTSFSVTPTGGAWTTSPAGIATVSTGGLATGIMAGTTTISYVASGCTTTRSLTVNIGISAITGTPAVCVSAATTLSNPTTGGAWSSSSPAVAVVGGGSGIVTGNSVGTAVISYLMSGCVATRVVSVSSLPGLITGTASVCLGSSTVLTGTGSPSPTWTSGTPTVATVSSSGVVSGLTTGTSVITYNAAGCGSTTRIVTVNSTCSGTPVPGAVAVSASIVCSGTPLVLSLPGYTPVCGHAIQWQYSPDGITWSSLPGATTAPYTYVPTGAFYYRCGITCVSGGLSAFSGPAHVAVDFTIGTHSIIDAPSTSCDPTHFYVSACGVSASFSVTTFFGDGTSVSTPLSTTTLSDAHFYHTYSLPGTYTVTHIMYNGAVPEDTVTFDYNYKFCRTLPIKFYQDNNSNCVFDAGDIDNVAPVTTRIDSNGIPIDTIVATSGFFYKANGGPGTVYAFWPLSVEGGLVAPCPATGVLYDTINTYTNTYTTKQIGIRCGPVSGSFDLKIDATVSTGRHAQRIEMVVTNFYCTTITPVVTLNYNPKYGYFPSYSYTSPTPTTVSGTTITWTLAPIAANATRTVTVWLERPLTMGPWLVPGDTVSTMISVSPTTGDLTPANNVINRVDTVKSSFDPNDLAVSPEGFILPCTRLQYKVRFENTGNDTAHNIYVLDTLPADLDPSSLEVVIASHPMNIAVINDGVRNIARFEFPNINLLDSSHHNLCSGMFIFSIKAISSVADGTDIANQVGIYFDENPAVMTNTVHNTTGLGPILGPANVCIGYPASFFNSMPGGTWASSTPAVGTITGGGVVSGVTSGTTLISYTVYNSCTTRTATKEATVNPVVVPSVSIAASTSDTICAGTSVTYTYTSLFSGLTPAYTWRVNGTSVGSSASYTYMPTAGDTVTLALASSQACAIPSIVADTLPMTVIAMATPVAGISVSPDDTSCAGTPVTFTATPAYGGPTPGYIWFVNGIVAGTGATHVFTPATGDVVYCRMGSDFMCRLADTVNSSSITMTVDPLYIPDIAIAASPGLTIGMGDALTLTASVVNAGPDPVYEWLINGLVIPGANTNTFTSSTFSDYDSVVCRVTGSGICHITSFNYVFVSVLPVGVRSITVGHDVHLFPNPNKGGFTVSGIVGNEGGQAVSLTINNMLGQVLYNSAGYTEADGNFSQWVQLPGDLANGVYQLNLRTADEVRTFRFVVDK